MHFPSPPQQSLCNISHLYGWVGGWMDPRWIEVLPHVPALQQEDWVAMPEPVSHQNQGVAFPWLCGELTPGAALCLTPNSSSAEAGACCFPTESVYDSGYRQRDSRSSGERASLALPRLRGSQAQPARVKTALTTPAAHAINHSTLWGGKKSGLLKKAEIIIDRYQYYESLWNQNNLKKSFPFSLCKNPGIKFSA